MNFMMKTVCGVPFLSSAMLEETGILVHGFSTRLGGISSPPFDHMNLGYNRGDDPHCVRENYRRFCTAIGADHTRVVKSHQIHTADIRTVTARDIQADLCTPAPYEADGLVTDEPGLCLTIFSADCVPVLLCDPHRRCVAAVHSGWRSTALSICARAVETMVTRYGCAPGNILAAVGPAISTCCFETHPDVPNAMTAAFGHRALTFIRSSGSGKFNVDLKSLIAHTLQDAGVRAEHTQVSDLCTACRPDLFFSHRLTGNARGSMAAMIQLTE